MNFQISVELNVFLRTDVHNDFNNCKLAFDKKKTMPKKQKHISYGWNDVLDWEQEAKEKEKQIVKEEEERSKKKEAERFVRENAAKDLRKALNEDGEVVSEIFIKQEMINE